MWAGGGSLQREERQSRQGGSQSVSQSASQGDKTDNSAAGRGREKGKGEVTVTVMVTVVFSREHTLSSAAMHRAARDGSRRRQGIGIVGLDAQALLATNGGPAFWPFRSRINSTARALHLHGLQRRMIGGWAKNLMGGGERVGARCLSGRRRGDGGPGARWARRWSSLEHTRSRGLERRMQR